MGNFRALVSLLGLAAAPRMAAAHGRMTSPMARNIIHSDANSLGNANAAVGGGPGSVHDGGRYLHGICGDAPGGSQTYNRVGAVQATYTAGQSAEFKLKLKAHHMGFFEFELCDDAGQLSEECFTSHRLLKEGCECSCPDGSNSCAACDACRRWWKPLMSSEASSWVASGYEGPVLEGMYLDEVEFTMKYVVPAGVATPHGVIRWHYMTTNSCTSHSSAPEEFWNCADVAITDGDSAGGAVSFDNNALASMQPQDLRPAVDGGELEGVYAACPEDASGGLLGVGSPDDYLGSCGASNQYCVRTDGEGGSAETATQSPSPTGSSTPAPTPAETASPTLAPTPAETASPTPAPTPAETASPTPAPTTQPATTAAPTTQPATTAAPTTQPATTAAPTTQPATAAPADGACVREMDCAKSLWCHDASYDAWCANLAVSECTMAQCRVSGETAPEPEPEPEPTPEPTAAPTTQPATTAAPTTQPATTAAPTTQPATTAPADGACVREMDCAKSPWCHDASYDAWCANLAVSECTMAQCRVSGETALALPETGRAARRIRKHAFLGAALLQTASSASRGASGEL